MLKTETKTLHSVDLVGARSARWVVARHIGTGGTYYMNGAGYIEGAVAASSSTARGPPTADKHAGSHPPAMEQNVVIFI